MSDSGGSGPQDPVIIAGYRGFKEIGRGGFGIVYTAHQEGVDRAVAVKVLHGLSFDERALAQFDAERRSMGALSAHPNIVTIHDSGVTDRGQPYLVMEYMSGGSIADRLDQWGPMEPEEASAIVVKIAGALESAHRSRIVHGDVKPENILLSAYGEPHLADFGIARMVQNAYGTVSHGLSGSLSHVAPELLGGDRPSPLSDVYSLGSTLFALLAGRPPFILPDDGTYLAALPRIQNDPVPDVREFGAPAGIAEVVARATVKDPSARYPTAAALAEDLQTAGRTQGWSMPSPAIEGEARPAPPPPVPRPVVPRRRLWPVLAAVGAVIAGVVAVAVLTGGDGADDDAPASAAAPATSPTATTVPPPATAESEPTTTAAGPSTTTPPAPTTTETPTTTTLPPLVTPEAQWVAAFDAANDVAGPGVGPNLAVLGTNDGVLRAVDVATGEAMWSVSVGDPIHAAPAPVDDGFVLADKGGVMRRLDSAGEEVWRYNGGSFGGTPLLVDGAAVLGGNDDRVHAVDLETGRARWVSAVDGDVIGMAAHDAARAVIYTGTITGTFYALDVESGSILWSLALGGGVWGSPAVEGDVAVVGTIVTNEIIGIDLESGAILWQFATGDFVRGSPLIVDGIAYIGSHDFTFYAMDIATGDLVWTHPLGLDSRIDGRPAVLGDIVYTAGGTVGAGLDRASGDLRWSFDLDATARGDVVAVDGTVYLADGEGRLYAVPSS